MLRIRRSLVFLLALAVVLGAAPGAAADTLGGVVLPPAGGSRTTGPIVLGGQPGPTVSGKLGVLIGDKAYAPAKAPLTVKRVIWAANRIRHKPYKWGGGHGSWTDSGYDCSGSVSYALHGGGLLSSPLDSRGFMRWGSSGPGRWITVYARDGHAFMVVAGLQFNTSGAGEHGPRWRLGSVPAGGMVPRHPSGL
jgi:hypothetical protein